MSVVDGAFVFEDSDHLYRYFTSDASDELTRGLRGGDRHSHPGCLEHGGPTVHGQRAHPCA